YIFSSVSSAFLLPDPATSAIYTLSLHDALPILLRRTGSGRGVRGGRLRHDAVRTQPGTGRGGRPRPVHRPTAGDHPDPAGDDGEDRKSTRLNSSHVKISYAVFCLKKKTKSGKIT